MADGLPAGAGGVTGMGVVVGCIDWSACIDCAASVLVNVTVVLLRSVESISPLKATTICGSPRLTMDPLAGEVVATLKCCTALIEALRDMAAAGLGAPAVIH